jgi:pimeloyl-ACP methyl ester carboxylesterase
MRTCQPDRSSTVERDGVRVGYDVYGDGLARRGPTLLLLTSWAIVHARQWKAQVPHLSRHFQVVTVKGRGNGRADRPSTQEAYTDREYVDDAVTVLDAPRIERAVVGGLSMGARHPVQLAA